MEHGPDRDKILESYKILNAQYDVTVDRARADLQSGLPLEDLILGGVAEFAKAPADALAATLTCRILREAAKPVPKPRKKTSVPAKRARVSREVPDGQSTA